MDKEKELAISNAIEAMLNEPYEVTEAKRAKERQEQAAAIRNIARPEGRYSINEATLLLLAETGEFIRLGEPVWNGELISYALGSNKKIITQGNNPKDWTRYDTTAEVYWNDLNDWLKEKYPRVKYEFPKPHLPTAKAKGTMPGNNWTDKARAIADSEALTRYTRGEREITARNISGAVATELAKDSTTHGIRGERGAGNIRNIALKGWKFIPPTGTNGTSGTKK